MYQIIVRYEKGKFCMWQGECMVTLYHLLNFSVKLILLLKTVRNTVATYNATTVLIH